MTEILNEIVAYFASFALFDPKNPLLFTQFNFWVFFALVMLGFSFTRNKRLMRNAFLFAVSLFFYYKTCGLFVFLLIFTTCSDFLFGQLIHRAATQAAKKAFLTASLAISLGLLCYFKYAYFFTNVYNNLFQTDYQVVNYLAQWANNLTGTGFSVDRIILPVGISFYTFQTISYVIDVYRGRIEPLRNILDYGFYVSFFPQLVAGPIVRANEFIPQLKKNYFLSRRQFGMAIFWILNGLAKKIILSDYLAVNFVDRIFTNPTMYTGVENLMGLFLYSLQVYADFSGYTDIAIGTAMLMGFYLPKNFNAPYKASNPGNFWKRWHISLSRWLTDYLYIPMGGNRNVTVASYLIFGAIVFVALALTRNVWLMVGVLVLVAAVAVVAMLSPTARKRIETNINVMNTMLLGGIWHGASWNFMIWGGLNGLGVVAFKSWKNYSVWRKGAITGAALLLFVGLRMAFDHPLLTIGVVWSGLFFFGYLVEMLCALFHSRLNARLQNAWAVLMTFIFVTFTRLFFRSGSNLDPALANETAWQTAGNMIAKIGGAWDWSLVGRIFAEHYRVFGLFALGMLIHWLPDSFKRRYRYSFAALPRAVQLVTAAVVIFVVYQFSTADLQAFIYFQF